MTKGYENFLPKTTGQIAIHAAHQMTSYRNKQGDYFLVLGPLAALIISAANIGAARKLSYADVESPFPFNRCKEMGVGCRHNKPHKTLTRIMGDEKSFDVGFWGAQSSAIGGLYDSYCTRRIAGGRCRRRSAMARFNDDIDW